MDASSIDGFALGQAEQAIKDMADEYLEWVNVDISNLEASYTKAVKGEAAKDEIYDNAHELKGQGGSFDYPLMTAVGNQLCKFIEGIKDELNPAQLQVVKVHIDTMKLIILERMSGDGGKAGDRLLKGLDLVIAKVNSKS